MTKLRAGPKVEPHFSAPHLQLRALDLCIAALTAASTARKQAAERATSPRQANSVKKQCWTRLQVRRTTCPGWLRGARWRRIQRATSSQGRRVTRLAGEGLPGSAAVCIVRLDADHARVYVCPCTCGTGRHSGLCTRRLHAHRAQCRLAEYAMSSSLNSSWRLLCAKFGVRGGVRIPMQDAAG